MYRLLWIPDRWSFGTYKYLRLLIGIYLYAENFVIQCAVQCGIWLWNSKSKQFEIKNLPSFQLIHICQRNILDKPIVSFSYIKFYVNSLDSFIRIIRITFDTMLQVNRMPIPQWFAQTFGIETFYEIFMRKSSPFISEA